MVQQDLITAVQSLTDEGKGNGREGIGIGT